MTQSKQIFFLVVFCAMTILGKSQTLKESKMVQVNGIDLHYDVYGEGEPLLLLHGWTQSSQYWNGFIAAYADRFTVYALDMRGHGRTTPLSDDFSIQLASKDIAAFIDQLKLEKVKAIGLSFGGLVLLQLANIYPDKIESMVLMASSHNYGGQDNKGMNANFKFENLPAAFIESLKRAHTQGDGQIRALFNPNMNYEIRLTVDEVKLIQIPTFVISGDHDEVLGIKAAFDLHSNLPNSSLWMVPDAGHIPVNDGNKLEFLRLTNEFLSGKETE